MHSIMKITVLSVSLLASTCFGHSWLECSNEEVRNMAALKSGDRSVYPDWTCHGYPRNKIYNGDWIKETINYLWDLGGDRARNEEAATGKKFACHPLQRQPVYPSNVPAAHAKPGDTLLLRFWGNGHTSWQYGAPIHKDPGLVRVYSGGKDGYIETASQLTPDKIIAESNFSANAISYEKAGGSPDDRANWMNLHIPGNWDAGRYFMVWTWAPTYDPFLKDWRNSYTTCFDIYVEGPKKPDNTQPPPKHVEPPNGGLNPQCQAACNRGGQPKFMCNDGANCPPCRYSANGVQSCYEYVPGKDGTCPFGNGFDCKKNKPL